MDGRTNSNDGAESESVSMKTKSLPIGTEVLFSRAYKRKAGHRFIFGPTYDLKAIIAEPTPIHQLVEGRGWIVGERSVIMKNYKFTNATYGEDGGDPGYASGDRETVYLVIKHIRQEPFIVRKNDLRIA